jgi:PAS domain S-box-containing protein
MGFLKSPLDTSKSALMRVWSSIRTLFLSNSLRRSVVIAILFISLVPVLLVGTVSYYRTRVQIQNLVAAQLSQITDSSAKQLEEFSDVRSTALKNLATSNDFLVTAKTAVDPKANASEKTTAFFGLRNQLTVAATGTSADPVFNELFIVTSDGIVLSSNDSLFITNFFGTNSKVVELTTKSLINKNASLPAYNIYNYNNRLVLLTSQTFKIKDYPEQFTIIGISSTSIYSRALTQASAFFPEASAFYYTNDESIIRNQPNSEVATLTKDKSVSAAVNPVVKGIQTLQPLQFISFDKKLVLAYVRAIKGQPFSIVLQVPSDSIFGKIPFLDGFSLYTLVLVLIVLAGLAYVGASSVVNPLMQLSLVAKSFSEGNFQQRANLNRKDEIGDLASSMNTMAADLQSLYTSLEEKVEQRTSQLRAASEIALLATSSNRLDETLERTVNLLTDRFGYYHTSIYLVDETQANILLREGSGEIGKEQKKRAYRIPIGSNNLVGWVAKNNQAHAIQDISRDELYVPDVILPNTKSEVALPISTGKEVLGVLTVQSSNPDTFDPDTVFVLQTLSNQIAGALQNIRLLESTQVDLEEISLLFRVTRQITEANTEEEAMQYLVESMPQIPRVSALLSMRGSSLRIMALYDPRTHKLENTLDTIDISTHKFIGELLPGKPIFISDISQPSNFDNVLSFFSRRSSHSVAILPSIVDGMVSKVLVLGFREDERVNQSILQPFINLAEIIGAKLGRLILSESLKIRLNKLQTLANFSQSTSPHIRLEPLFKALHEQIIQTFGPELGFIISFYDRDSQTIEFPYAYENLDQLFLDKIPVGQGLTSIVIRNHQPLLLTDRAERRAAELGAHILGSPAKSWMGIPLMVEDEILGVMILQDQTKEYRFNQADVDLLMSLTPFITTEIHNALLVETMQKDLAEYQQERQLLDAWLASSPDLITIKNKDGHYIRCSQVALNTFDLTFKEVVGKTDFDLLPQDLASQIYEKDIEVLNTGVPRIGDVDDNIVREVRTWYLTSRIPIRDANGNVFGLLSVRQDISDIKRAEKYADDRADEIRTAAEIARDSSSILDIDELLAKVVNLVRERFGFYHVSVFLVDSLMEMAVLKESTGEAGRQMKLNHHRLAVGSKSIVGQATSRGEAVIIPDVTIDPTHLPNPLLPDTRAELAIPFRAAGEIIGALDVQSTQANSFSPEDINILGVLADQIASAIQNTRLFAAAQEMLGKHRLLHQINIAATSSTTLQDSLERVVNGLKIANIADRIILFMLNKNNTLDSYAFAGYEDRQPPQLHAQMGQGIVGISAHERRVIRVNDCRADTHYISVDSQTLSELALPILFGDDLIGVLNLESDSLAAFTENDEEIMGALTNNLAAVVSNWRLVQQIRQQVDRQQMLFDATSKIRRSVDIQTILQTSINEIGKVTGAYRAQIKLSAAASPANSTTPVTISDLNSSAPTIKPNGNNGYHSGEEVK